ncbi:phosphomannomutase [Psychromonas sp. SA13A]|uniref:phosphomannomutase n=1 Tax=Psychromonas sp. SA13A TaxID=2686346 RepID=UPI001F102B48|nr:phosphomannomutase [Psychromonas sp. SA13A]
MINDFMLDSAKVMRESGIVFGTSGVRGLVSQFSAEVCAAFTVAFVGSIKRTFNFQTIAIAIDNRPSSYAMAQACASALTQLNIKVIYFGVVPTPALANIAMEDKIPAIMVTGSHIPFDRNGLKFYRPDGEISKADEKSILSENIEFYHLKNLRILNISNRASEAYIARYTSLFDTPLKGKRIGVYEHSSAGRDLYYRIFEKLGAEVISLDRTEHFVPIDTEAVADREISMARIWSKKYKLDAIFSTDGDGDRPLISDENGQWLRGDILGLLTAKALNIEAIAVPINCNTAIELCKCFKEIERTRIGSPYVIAEFERLSKKFTTVAGFEANGGFMLASSIVLNGKLLKALPTRDAVLPAIMLLASADNNSISTLVNDLPKRFTHSDRIQNFAPEKSRAIIEGIQQAPERMLIQFGFKQVNIKELDTTDGLRITLTDGIIIHLRISGNAPELRCYVEASCHLDTVKYVTCILKGITLQNLILE